MLPVGDEDLRLKFEIRIGLSYFFLGDNENAQSHYSYVIERTNKDSLSIFRAHALNNLGLLYDHIGNFEKSIRAYERAGAVYALLDEQLSFDRTQMNIGKVLSKKGNYTGALKIFTHVARSFEESKDSLRIGETYSSIGLIQGSLGSIQKAKEFHEKAIVIWKALNNDDGLASSYNNIGFVYQEANQSDSALWFYREAIRLMEGINARNIGQCYHNMGTVFETRGEYSKAKSHFLKALNHKKALSDSNEVVITANKLAEIENNHRKWSSAKQYLRTAKNYMNASRSKLNMKMYYREWKNYYKGIEMPDSALYFLEESNRLDQEILSEAYLGELAGLQESYEADKRKSDIERLNVKSQNQEIKLGSKERSINQLAWGMVAAGMIILLLILVILLLRQRAKKKELESKMRGVEDEKKRLSMELHDASGANLRNLATGILSLVEKSKGDIQQQLEELHKKTESTLSEIVMISHTLHHPRIETAVFSILLEDFIYDWLQHKEYSYEQDLKGIEVLNEFNTDAKSHIYRFIQETLINIDKHTKATRVSISLAVNKDTVVIQIKDNGKKIVNEMRKGIGHKNLEDRANIMKGSFEFNQSKTGSNSILTVPVSFNTK